MIEYVVTSVISIIMLLLLLYLICNNINLNSVKRKNYSITIILTCAVIISEISTMLLDVNDPYYRVPNIIFNIIGFVLSLLIPVFISIVFYNKLLKSIKFIMIPIFIASIFIVLSSWFNLVFWIDKNNVYNRGPFFFVYVIVYMGNLAILIISNYKNSLEYEHKERIFFSLLMAVIVIGTSLQVIFPNVHSTWQCVSIVLVMYYLYLRELQFKYDILTNVLNRRAFEEKLDVLKQNDNVCIIQFDIDNFKLINDTYGHSVGDDYLKVAADVINLNFSDIGKCYRIGGDEFCVLIPDVNENELAECLIKMANDIATYQKVDNMIPNISYGYSFYNFSGGDRILEKLKEADEKMYKCKSYK